jgi:diguanylate cyclase (GGDEF)-like protein
MKELGLLIVAVLALAGVAAVWYRGRKHSGGAGRSRSKVNLDKQDAETPGPDGTPPTPETSKLEHSKLVIHALLQSVSANVESLMGGSEAYSDSLNHHKTAITRAMTIAGIKELERVMVDEISKMQDVNARYHRELESANSKLAQQKQEVERLQTDVGVDFLTRIPNRRAFDERVAEEISRAKRYNTTFSMVVIDVDHFKRINDVYGHLAGDRILRALAQLLDKQKRASDFVARFGGEEFVLLLPETDADRAAALAGKTREKVGGAKFRFESKSIRVTISAGVGEVQCGKDTAASLFARIDAALYRAKEGGRNRVELAEPPESAKS